MSYLIAVTFSILAFMKPQTPPPDLNWVTPYLVVQDVKKALDFYTKVFQFEVHETFLNNREKIVFARIRYNGSNIIMGPKTSFEGEPNYGDPPGVSGNLSPVGIYVYCDNLEERYHLAKQLGAKILISPEKKFWGDTLFTVEDPDGYIWTFAERTHPFTPELLPEELKPKS